MNKDEQEKYKLKLNQYSIDQLYNEAREKDNVLALIVLERYTELEQEILSVDYEELS